MKRVYKYLILFICVYIVFSCESKPQVFSIESEVSWSMESFNYYQDSLMTDYRLRVHESMNKNGLYPISYILLEKTIRNEGEKSFYRSFDEVYEKFGEKNVQKVLQKKHSIPSDNKEDTKTFLVNDFTANVIGAIANQITIETLLINAKFY